MAKNIEIDPPSVPEIEVIRHIAPKLEESLNRRNNFKDPETSERRDVSSTVLFPSKWFPNIEAFHEIRREHKEHMRYLDEAGIEAAVPMAEATKGNLLTERNLPQYHEFLMRELVNRDDEIEDLEPFKRWTRTWTAEEHPHEDVLKYTLLATGIVSMREFELGALAVETTELGVQVDDLISLWAYTMPQEAATEISHLNTGKLHTKTIRDMMAELSRNESTHKKAMTDFLKWSLEIDPEYTVQVLFKQFRNFEMPGKAGIPNFAVYENEVAIAGLYDHAAFRRLGRTSLKQLNIAGLDLKSDGRADEYRHKLFEYVDDESRTSRIMDTKLQEEREKRIAEMAKKGMVPFILDVTVKVERGQPPTPIRDAA